MDAGTSSSGPLCDFLNDLTIQQIVRKGVNSAVAKIQRWQRVVFLGQELIKE